MGVSVQASAKLIQSSEGVGCLIERTVMTPEMWNVVIGGAIAALSGCLTALIAARLETNRWVRGKKIEHLQLRISELKPILDQGAAIIKEYENGDRIGLTMQHGAESVIMITYMSSKSCSLWRDVIEAAKEEEKDRRDVYDAWLNSIASDIVDARAKIEELLN